MYLKQMAALDDEQGKILNSFAMSAADKPADEFKGWIKGGKWDDAKKLIENNATTVYADRLASFKAGEAKKTGKHHPYYLWVTSRIKKYRLNQATISGLLESIEEHKDTVELGDKEGTTFVLMFVLCPCSELR